MTPGTVVQIIDEDSRTIHSHFSPISAPKTEKPFLSEKEMPDEAVLRADYEKLRITHELQRGINFDMSIANILDHVLNCTFELLPCDRGIILMPNNNGALKPRAFKSTSEEKRFIISNTLVRYLQKNKKGIVSTDAMADDRLSGAQSIIKKGTHSTIAVPILEQTQMIGIIILESSNAVSAYNAKDLLLLTNIANQTSQFIKTSQMAKKIKEDAITRKRFQRLLSPNLAEMVVSGQLKVEKGGENRIATVMFADIRNFTYLSENARPTDVLHMLNDYFEVAVDTVFHHEGTVDKFIGDAIMAIWGAPVAHDNDPIRAVRAAIEMQNLLVEFNKIREAEGLYQIQVGIGINTGNLVAGYIGSSHTMSYSVIGKTVNTAYRLCSEAKPGQILISEHTQNQVQNAFNITELESIPAQANAVMEDLKSLFEKLKEADVLHKRLKSIDRDAEVFTTNVTTLVDRVAQGFKELPVEQAASELNTALNRSRTAKAQFDRLEKQRDQEQERVRGAEQNISGIRSELDTMCEEARCSKYEDLAEAERRSSKRRQIEANVEDLEGQLHKLSAGATIDDFVAEALAVDPDGIEGQIGKLNEKINALNQEKSDLDQTIGEERNELRKMDGSAKAAELAEANQGILARLERYTEKYARLRIASAVLAQAIERYREKHQGPILKRTNEIFANLTLGFFEGIRAEFDENGNPVLMGVRPGGKELVGVNGMSDGTTDQLYLSLRLSSLESYLDNNEPMPFIVDDILIKFDNERAIATLKVLAELSKKTQVIFFTHHHHLVELAEASIESSLLFNHALETSLENRRTY